MHHDSMNWASYAYISEVIGWHMYVVCNMFYRFTIGIWGTSVLCWSVLFIVHRQGFHWSQSWPVSQSQNCYRSQNPDRDIWDHFTFTSFWPVLTVILSDRYPKSDRLSWPWKPCPSHSSTNCHSLYLVPRHAIHHLKSLFPPDHEEEEEEEDDTRVKIW